MGQGDDIIIVVEGERNDTHDTKNKKIKILSEESHDTYGTRLAPSEDPVGRPPARFENSASP